MRGLGLALVALLLASGAQAAGGQDDDAGKVAEFIWQALNLALLIGVVLYFARRPLQNFFAERRRAIRERLEGSARLLDEAEARLAEWQDRLERLEGEVGEIRSTTQRLGEAERQRILAEARASAERTRRDAASAVDREVRRARTALREEASDLAVELAERLLRESVNQDDRNRLLEEFVERVEHAPSVRR